MIVLFASWFIEHEKIYILEYAETHLFNIDDVPLEKIKKNDDESNDENSKCLSPKYTWTEWNSLTDPLAEGSDGNDYELLDDHRSLNQRWSFQLYYQPWHFIF